MGIYDTKVASEMATTQLKNETQIHEKGNPKGSEKWIENSCKSTDYRPVYHAKGLWNCQKMGLE